MLSKEITKNCYYCFYLLLQPAIIVYSTSSKEDPSEQCCQELGYFYTVATGLLVRGLKQPDIPLARIQLLAPRTRF